MDNTSVRKKASTPNNAMLLVTLEKIDENNNRRSPMQRTIRRNDLVSSRMHVKNDMMHKAVMKMESRGEETLKPLQEVNLISLWLITLYINENKKRRTRAKINKYGTVLPTPTTLIKSSLQKNVTSNKNKDRGKVTFKITYFMT